MQEAYYDYIRYSTKYGRVYLSVDRCRVIFVYVLFIYEYNHLCNQLQMMWFWIKYGLVGLVVTCDARG